MSSPLPARRNRSSFIDAEPTETQPEWLEERPVSSALSSLLLANHKGDASALRLELQDPTKVLALLQSSPRPA